ncbi:DUF6119 family protein [Acidobacteriota bacterium]
MSETLKKVSVFLIKKGIDNLDDSIKFKSADNPKKIDLVPEVDAQDGAFYLGKSSQREPEWLGFLNQLAVEEQELELNTTNSAALVLKLKEIERIFAFCFGYGRFLINMDTIERQFGLKLALNIIDPQKLRTMDYKKYEEVVISTKQQVSRGSALRTFEIDINSELLRNIGGMVKDDEAIGNSVYGSDSAVINLKESVGKTNISEICKELFDLYSRADYKENFDFIDHYAALSNPVIIEQLDNLLLDTIKERRLDAFHMAPPEIFDYEDSDGFGFSTLPDGNAPKIELEPVDYIDSIADLDQLTVHQLKKDQVRVKSTATGNWEDRWPVYNCIVFESELDENYFVFHEGSWFQVEKNFVEQLNNEIKAVARAATVNLPPAPTEFDNEVVKRFSETEKEKLKTTHEKYYNEYVGWKHDDKVTLDRRNVRPTDSRSPIEFCDIITTKGQLVHVKPGTSSSKLSHLFKQGSVSAELFVSDAKLREKVIKIIQDDTIFKRLEHWTEEDRQKERQKQKRKDLIELLTDNKNEVDRSRFEVVYCIIKNIPDDQWPEKIPFFSKVSLRREKRAIEKLGFQVSLTKV